MSPLLLYLTISHIGMNTAAIARAKIMASMEATEKEKMENQSDR